MKDMRDAVARAIHTQESHDSGSWEGCEICEDSADAAITTVLTMMADAADAQDLSLVRCVIIPGTYLVEDGDDVSEWIRSFLPSQPEVTGE